MTEATQTALIVGGFSLAGMVITSLTQIILSRKGREQVVATIVKGNEEVAKAVDGQLSKYVEEVRRAERETGKREGGEAERDRPPDLITEPGQVHDAMNGKAVREQMDAIQQAQAAHASAIEDVKDAHTQVAKDLAEAHERADAHVGGEPGEAADAAARLTGTDKQLLKDKK